MYKKICITNRGLVKGDFLEQIRRVADEGVDMVILREKDLSEEEYLLLAQNVIDICTRRNTLCVLHTFIRAAKKLNHPYIHLSMKAFQEMSDEDKAFFRVIGVSTHTVAEAVQAEQGGASYITASHIFPTECKAGLAPRGLAYLQEVVQAVHIEVYALGGIHPDNLSLCVEAGADGVCMMSEYMKMGQT